MNILVTGGAGYIGSHAVKLLVERGHRVAVVDSLEVGHRAAVHPDAAFAQLDLRDTDRLAAFMTDHGTEAVMHFAAYAQVGESVREPLKYWDNNTGGSTSLLRAIERAGVRRMVFSSTCATYGEPSDMPIVETTPQKPINPYGASKLAVERILADYAQAHPDFAYAALRYFNVAGAASDGSIGEDHTPETHIIPLLLLTALGQRQHFTIFGQDYPTPDGTCIRDYVHVQDLVDAHAVVLHTLADGDQRHYNLGIGRGYSVREVYDAACKVTGVKIPVTLGQRRPGDPPSLYANADRIRTQTSWTPRYTDLHLVIETAWNWFRRHPHGYPK